MSLITNLTEIKNLPIADVVGQYVTLRRAGTRMVACCPFHNENSASFGVSPSRNIFKCFGCGAAGDGIEFVMRHENMSFLEAVERIAKDQNIHLEMDRSVDFDAEKAKQEEARKAQESLHLVQEWAAKTYFDRNFQGWTWSEASMDGRRLSMATIEAFGLCYTGDDNLIRAMSTEDAWGMDVLLQTGLLKEGQHGSGTYDGFGRRSLFPIRDQRGKMAGFGARLLKDDQEKPGNKRPKYINSPETPVYHKSNLLYGLWQNRQAIGKEKVDYARNEGFAYIVEGYMDVVTMYDFGIQNAVAPCGTSLTDEQIDLLHKYTDEVVLCFDSDKAGEAATTRSIERLLTKGFKVQILFLAGPFGPAHFDEHGLMSSQKHDADSYLRTYGLTLPRTKTVGLEVQRTRYYIEGELLKVAGKRAQQPQRHYLFEGNPFPFPLKCSAEDILKDEGTKIYEISVESGGDKGWAGAMKHHLKDAIEWMVLRDFRPGDPHSRTEAIETAARLLSHLDSEILKNRYLENLCQKQLLGNVKRDLNDAIAMRRDEFLSRGRHKFSKQQELDRLRYGIYLDAKKFWQAQGDGEGWELTNFIVEPLMCVIGSKRSLRLVKIINEDGMQSTLEMDSDDIVELSTFKKVVARKGNFVFKANCRAEHFARIQAKIMAETPNVYPIYTMGMHELADGACFYAFANGIFTREGFLPVDDFGSVKVGEVTYYLPAFSKVHVGGLGEHVTDSFEDIKVYFYPARVKEISFKEWTGRVRDVYGKNGMVGAAWALAAIHRDIIIKRFDMFPHLNLFGVPQSGKNQLAGSLTALFGLSQPPIGLENATKAAMTRLISVLRNGVVWFDEYKNDVDRWIVEILKGFADGTSRRKGDSNAENRTISTPVNSAAIVSGQHQLTLDPALFSRTISLNFSTTTYTDEERTALRELKEIEKSGALTRLTTKVHGTRDAFKEKFNTEFEFVRTDFSSSFQDGLVVSDRVLNMFCIPLTTFRILIGEGLEFAFSYDELKKALLDLVMVQRENMFAENEVSIWWRIIEFLLERGELKHGQDILVEYADHENFDEDWSGKRQRKVQYADPTGSGAVKLVYFYFGVSHPLYMRQHFDERRVKGLDKQALFLYLRSSDAFAGLKRAKKFAGKPKSCMVFQADQLPFEIPLSIEVLAREDRRKDQQQEEPSVADQAPVAGHQEDLPF